MELSLDFTPLGLAMKTRNAMFDSVFYDVSSLTFSEWLSLNPLKDRKGMIIVVSPTGSVSPTTGLPKGIRQYSSAPEFMASDDWNSVFAVAVTGVGSSAVGTAALARNVADACKATIGGDVAGVVSGFGASDVVQEGLGGYFFYGMLNQYRFMLEKAIQNMGAVVSDSFAKSDDIQKQVADILGTSPEDDVPIGVDVYALECILSAILLHRNTSIRLLVGHSKGNLLIADAVNHMSNQLKNVENVKHVKHVKDKVFLQNLAVVTLGAVVDIADMIPKENQYQFLGSLDSLGLCNSRWDMDGLAPHTSLPGKWHSLNRRLYLHTDVPEILQQVKIPPPRPIETGQDGKDRVGLERLNVLETAL
jgi:hypothetical protein